MNKLLYEKYVSYEVDSNGKKLSKTIGVRPTKFKKFFDNLPDYILNTYMLLYGVVVFLYLIRSLILLF